MAYSADSTIVSMEEFGGFFRVQYQRAGELVAQFQWFDTQEEADEFVATLSHPAPHNGVK